MCVCSLASAFESPIIINIQDALAERLERYAKASGHPRLMELLTRHANEQKEKFTLSDDENEDEVGTEKNYVRAKNHSRCATRRVLAILYITVRWARLLSLESNNSH